MEQQPTYKVVIEKIRRDNHAIAEIIEHRLKTWKVNSSKGSKIVDNIKKDYHINEDYMREILDYLYFTKDIALDALENAFKEKCHNYTLKGSAIDMVYVTANIGHAKTIGDFILAMKKVNTSFIDSDVEKLISKLQKDKLEDEDKKLAMAPYICWATWSHKDAKNPFEFAQHPKQVLKVIANLGLSHHQQKQSHLLFIYPKTAVVKLHIPTFADAGVHEYFNPSESDDKYGHTEPWKQDDCTSRGLKEDHVKSRPEGVHLPVKIGDLELPLLIIQP